MSDDLTIEYLPGDDGSAASPAPGSPGAPRQPRRRWLLLAGLVVVLVVAGVVGTRLIGPGPAPAAVVAVNPLPAPGTAPRIELDRAGFSGPVGGSLAGRADVLQQIRERVIDLAVAGGHALSTPGQVLVLWAGDLDGGRYAVVLYPQSEGWSRAVLSGLAGRPAAELAPASWADDDRDLVSTLTDRSATFVNPPDGPGAVFVTAPTVRGVEIAHGRRFPPGGGMTTAWRPLQKQGGMVWAGLLTATESYLAAYRTTDGEDLYPEQVSEPDGRAAVRRIASGSAAGSAAGRETLDCAADAVRTTGASPAERPVLATATSTRAGSTLAAVVLRSPDGGWLWGICADESDGGGLEQQYPGSGVARERWSDPGQVTAILPVVVSSGDGNDTDGNPRFVVLTPAGADEVRVKGVTAPVRDRLAEVQLREGVSLTRTTVEALRDGRVISRTTAGGPD